MPILIVPLCVGKFVLKQKYVLVSRMDCMGIYVLKAYNAVPKYFCVGMSPNLCSAVKLEADVNGGNEVPELSELSILGHLEGTGATCEFRCSRPIRLQHPSYYIPLLASCIYYSHFHLKNIVEVTRLGR